MKIIHWKTLKAAEKYSVLIRPTINNDKNIAANTANIIEAVKKYGDQALYNFTHQFDKIILDDLVVEQKSLDNAERLIPLKLITAITTTIERIKNYQKALLPNTVTIRENNEIICQRIPRPIDKVGLYVPGGATPLISSLMMLAIPAQLAACPLRVICTPPNSKNEINPALLLTAKLCGIKTIYKVGGAQAIAALAYGTETIPKVDKIYGPGNAWVTEAKKQVSQDPLGASIDLLAGPSEVLIIADQFADSNFIAADLLSQAEHGVDSQVILITTAKKIAHNTIKKMTMQLNKLPRKIIAKKALLNSKIILVDSIEESIKISNNYAPEHLIMQIKNPKKYLPLIQNAGAIFMGQWATETLGDYVTGANHVLPTCGYARTCNGLSVNDFMHYLSVQFINKQGLKKLGPIAMQLAKLEGLAAHAQAISLRLKKGKINE